jgi:hypothetical protein
LLSSTYIIIASAICLTLEVHEIRRAFSFAFASAGSNMLARIAMMAITTSNSISVKAQRAAVNLECR